MAKRTDRGSRILTQKAASQLAKQAGRTHTSHSVQGMSTRSGKVTVKNGKARIVHDG